MKRVRVMKKAIELYMPHPTVLRPTSHFIPTEAYEEWQDELLDTGHTFCDPTKHLSCSSISKKCECRPGTAWKPDENIFKCSAILGGHCWITGVQLPEKRLALYDPISFDFRDEHFILEDECQITGDSFCSRDLKLFLNNTCADTTIRDLDKKLENQFKDLPSLNFEDSCNLEHQTQLYTTTEAEINNYTIRVKNLEAILAAKTPFCDVKRFIICGNRGKCECIQPTTYNPETKSCTFKKPHGSCQGQSTFEKMAAAFPGKVAKEVVEAFKTVRDRECPFNCSKAMFPYGRLVQPTTSFCRTCPEDRGSFLIRVIGKNCDKDLTRFLKGAPPPSLPIDTPDYDKQVELFVQFNEKVKEFEKLFRLEKNSPCDYEGGMDAHRLIRRIRNVELPDKIFSEQNYKDLMSSMDKLIGQFGQKRLCQFFGIIRTGKLLTFPRPPWNRPVLLCGPTPTNSVCYNPDNTVYLEELMKRLSEKSFQATPSGSCAPHPRDVIKYAEKEFENRARSDQNPFGLDIEGYEYGFITLENHWIDNAQFCNRTGGFKCTKSVGDKTNATGKCEFSQAYLDEVQAEAEVERLAKLGNVTLTSKSSHHSIQHLIPALLFILHIIILN